MKSCAAVALLACPFALAQVLPTSAPPSLRTQTTVVLVPALVRNAKGELVFTLKAGDFRVTDDGVAQPLTLDEDTGSEPLALVVAVETGGGGRTKLDNYRNLTAVIDAVVGGVPHRVAVVAFDSAARVAQDFTPNVDEVGAALHDLDEGDKGAAILDGLKFSVDLLRSQPVNYRRAILLISETIDRGSQTKMEDALRDLSDTNTAIYSLGFSSGKADAAHYADRELPIRTPRRTRPCRRSIAWDCWLRRWRWRNWPPFARRMGCSAMCRRRWRRLRAENTSSLRTAGAWCGTCSPFQIMCRIGMCSAFSRSRLMRGIMRWS